MSRCVLALLMAAGLGLAGCGGSAGHAAATPTAAKAAARDCPHTVPADLAAPGPYRVRSGQIQLARRASTSTQIRHIDPSAWFPVAGSARCRFPVIVFSHGANGRPRYYGPLLTHLVSEGFVVLAPQHPDRTARGDESVERVADVTYVLAHLPAITKRVSAGLQNEVDPRRIGIAGHSYGAFVAAQEAVSEPRIRAALAMAGPLSPGPAAGTRVPVLAMTGGADTLVPSRLVRAYYDRLPATVPHGLLQIGHADHSAYGRHCTVERTCGIVDGYATSFFLTYLAGLRGADRLLKASTPRAARVRLQTVRMP